VSKEEDSQVSEMAAGMLQVYLEWTEHQFRLLGKSEQEAGDLSFDMIAGLQGTILLSAGFHSRPLFERTLERMEHWITTRKPKGGTHSSPDAEPPSCHTCPAALKERKLGN
jgi:hypothetical protein